jgi:excinuclease ABC subunit A
MSKPDVELIEGIPPAIAIEQKVNTRNPRSTIATSTEIYDYLRMIFARIGRTYSPVSGEEVKCSTVNDVITYVLNEDSDAVYILSDLGWNKRDDKVELMLQLKEEGYSRLFSDRMMRIEEVMQLASTGEYPQDMYLLVDRLRLPEADADAQVWDDLKTRLHSSVESAFDKGNGTLYIRREKAGEETVLKQFVNRFDSL